jgi:hypothetical protein
MTDNTTILMPKAAAPTGPTLAPGVGSRVGVGVGVGVGATYRVFAIEVAGVRREFVSLAAAEEQARELHANVMACRERNKAAYLALGRFLIGLKARVPHGQWLHLLRRNGLHQKVAERAMALAGSAAKNPEAAKGILSAGTVRQAQMAIGARTHAQAGSKTGTEVARKTTHGTNFSNTRASDVAGLSRAAVEAVGVPCRTVAENLGTHGSQAVRTVIGGGTSAGGGVGTAKAWAEPARQMTFDEVYEAVERLQRRAVQYVHRGCSAADLRAYAAEVLAMADRLETMGGGLAGG